MEQLFNISRLGQKQVEEISSRDNVPHVHDHEELLIGMEGEISHLLSTLFTMIEEYLFWDNMTYMNQIGLGK